MKPAGNIEQNVIACAHRLFIEKGYVNTSMSDIAAAVGITRPALHYYFRTKAALPGDLRRHPTGSDSAHP